MENRLAEVEEQLRELQRQMWILTQGDDWLKRVKTQSLTVGVSAGDHLQDLDGDTKVQVEQGGDDDTVRIDCNGNEEVTVTDTQFTCNPNADFKAGVDVNGNITCDGTVDGVDIAARDHAVYTDAEAVSAAEAAGLTLASTKVYSSADEDLVNLLGRAWVGYNGADGDEAGFGHRDVRDAGGYAIKQVAAGGTYVNAEDGQNLNLCVHDAVYLQITATKSHANGDITCTGTMEPAGDTAAGDNSALGYTAAEGAILTGQGSTSDITLKNDADGTVMSVPTGTTIASFPGQVRIDTEPDADHTVSGVTGVFTANEDQQIGDLCYIDGDGEMHLGDADAIATSAIAGMCADATISADASGNYLLVGVARDDTWTWTVGGLIYLTVTGTKGNTLSQSAPNGADDCVVIVGVATHADRILFNPSQQAIVEHTG